MLARCRPWIRSRKVSGWEFHKKDGFGRGEKPTPVRETHARDAASVERRRDLDQVLAAEPPEAASRYSPSSF